MLYILGECGGEEILPHVRVYSRHENSRVRFEAIKCLLELGDTYGIGAVKDLLRSESSDDVEQALSLAGTYRVREIVPVLAKMLRKKGIIGADVYDKAPIIHALGQIGDPSAMDELKALLSMKSILFKSSTEALKEEIYKSLDGYPVEDIKDLISEGANSKNETIRNESMRLKKKFLSEDN
jgi:HEAT repeat protein